MLDATVNDSFINEVIGVIATNESQRVLKRQVY